MEYERYYDDEAINEMFEAFEQPRLEEASMYRIIHNNNDR